MTKLFTIALLACVATSAAAQQSGQAGQSAQQKDKEKSGFSQPADPQPVMMPSGQRPEEWKFQKEKEGEANKAADDKKAAKKKAEDDKKAAADAKKQTEAERKLANRTAREEAEKQRAEERQAAIDKKQADETQRAAAASAEREAAAARRAEAQSKLAEEQKAADERRALERRAASEKISDERKAEAERAAEAVREKEAREAEKKAATRKAAEDRAAAKAEREAEERAERTAAKAAKAEKTSAPPPAAAHAPAPAPAPSEQKPAVDPTRPPAVIREGQTPDEWKMKSEKPRAEGSAGQGQAQKGKSSDAKSSDTKSSDAKSASATAGQSKPAASTPPKPKEPWRGWSDRALISLNAGWQTASFDLRDTRNFDPAIPGDREQRTMAADYSVKSGVSLDLGAGVRVWRGLAAGASVTRFKDSRDVPVTGTVPHPFFFNRARAINGVVSGAREEMAVHVDAMWVVPIRRKMTLALFGGPSFYSVKQTIVSDYNFSQSYPYDEVTLTGVVSTDESTSVTGINVGADVGYFFTDTIGVGGVIRFGRASIDTSIGSLDVGGPEFGVGLRIRIPQSRPRGRAVTPPPPPTKR